MPPPDEEQITEATSVEDLRAIVQAVGESTNHAVAHRLEDALRSRILVLIAMAGTDVFAGGPQTLADVVKLARVALLTNRFPFYRDCA